MKNAQLTVVLHPTRLHGGQAEEYASSTCSYWQCVRGLLRGYQAPTWRGSELTVTGAWVMNRASTAQIGAYLAGLPDPIPVATPLPPLLCRGIGAPLLRGACAGRLWLRCPLPLACITLDGWQQVLQPPKGDGTHLPNLSNQKGSDFGLLSVSWKVPGDLLIPHPISGKPGMFVCTQPCSVTL